MPRKASWLLKIPDALEKLTASRRPEFTTSDLATLLQLKRSQAAKLMKDWEADLVGRIRVMPRQQLIEVLEAVEASGDVRVELERKARQAAAIQEADELGPARELKLPVPAERRYIHRAEDLPGELEVTESSSGRALLVPFDSIPTLLARLYEVARVAAHDSDGLERFLMGAARRADPEAAGRRETE